MSVVSHELTHMPAKAAIQLIEFCRSHLCATEANVLADRIEKGASNRDVQDLAASAGGTSKKEAKKRASRAKATNANPDIAVKMSTGQMSTEQADVLAKAAEDTDGAAACDTELIETIANTSPEQGAKKATEFVNKHRSADGVQTRHDRQRRRRGWYRHRLHNGNAAITIHGDDESIDEMEKKISSDADAEYKADGGRDIPYGKHPRTTDQRGFDAAKKLFCSEPSSRTSEQENAKAKKPRKPQRHAIHVGITTDQISGVDDSVITACDGKPLPKSVVEEIACGSDIIPHIYSGDGELLWQGRKKRLATPAQINGLIARDGGCVLCQAHHSVCVAHHLIPWEAIDLGETNIDNLAFLCGDCHTRVHQRKWTLFYDPRSMTWNARPALPNEVAPENQHHNSKHDPGRYRTTPKTETGLPRLDEQRNNQRLGRF